VRPRPEPRTTVEVVTPVGVLAMLAALAVGDGAFVSLLIARALAGRRRTRLARA
jgi:hypothetical protein